MLSQSMRASYVKLFRSFKVPFSTISSCPVHYWPDHCTGVYPELSPVSCVRTKCGPHIWQLQISHHLAPSLSSHIAFIQSKNVTRTQFQNGTKSYPSNVTIRQSSNLPITQPSMSPKNNPQGGLLEEEAFQAEGIGRGHRGGGGKPSTRGSWA